MTVNNNTPEIRLKGFNEDWVEKKIESILTEENRNITLIDDESYELVTVKRRNQGVVSRGFLNGKDILVKNYFKVRAGDFLISKRQVIHGANGIVPLCLDKAIVSNEYLVIGDNKEIKTEFWALIARRPEMYEKFFLSSYGVDIEKMVFDVVDWKTRDVVIPRIDEQTAISNFFKNIDQNISLSRRKYEKTQTLKNVLLSKMFPQTGKNQPEIRLKGFSGDWVERKLGDIGSEFNGGGTPDTRNSNYWNGDIPWLQSSDIEVGNLLNNKPRKYITLLGVKNSATKVISENSIAIITRVGVGKVALIPFPYSTSQDFLSISNLNVDSLFLIFALSILMKKESNSTQGTSIKGITNKALLERTIATPKEKEEQAAIGQFFKQLDETLALQAKQLKALENLKKALLAKIFV